MISSVPTLAAVIEAVYPGLDLTQPSALLQLTFFSFGSFIIGLAGASFLAGWAGDEGRRRLEVVLSTPRSRASWAVRSGLGVLAAIGVVTRRHRGADRDRDRLAGRRRRSRRSSGIGILGLASAGLPSVGLAVGGLFRLSLGRRRDGLPGHRHAPHRYPGRGAQAARRRSSISRSTSTSASRSPGIFDPVGIVVAVVMVVGGVALCAFGLTRRDIGR